MSSSYSSQRTTKTYTYSSSDGQGGTQVTETTETTGPDGKRSESRTYHSGGPPPTQGFKNIDLNSHGQPQHKYGQHAPIISRTAPKAESRYQKGWGAHSRMSKSVPISTEGKTFQEIKDECLKQGKLFEDPDFPAVDQSIFFSRAPPRPFVWKRPPDLSSNPEFIVGGASRFDIQQGELGDCWLLAAVACLCCNKDLLYRVVPSDQSFSTANGYCGIFHFQFWQYGKWVDVIIDDRLPTYYDKLVFMHSAEKNEFWSPLLEKAYAKLTGSYEALKGGATSEAMEDFTGGVTEMYDFRQNVPANLFPIMLKSFEKGALMGCSIDANPNQLEAELDNGLIMGHAYSITCVKMVDIQTSRKKGSLPMVRIRNPWGNECEWKGAWSDKSSEWKYITEDERKEIGLTFNDDGEFWMAYKDFISNFQKLEICNLGPDSASSGDKKNWKATCQEGSWIRRVCAGGCRNFLDSFWTNPQYRIDVVDADEDDDENLGTVLVALMQKNRRKKRKEGLDLLTVGYAIYKLKESDTGPLDLRFFKYNASVAKAPAFINLREVCGRHKLPPGKYCLIPSTFDPNQEGDFLIRIYTESDTVSQELDEETGMTEVELHKGRSKSGKSRYHQKGQSHYQQSQTGKESINHIDFLSQYLDKKQADARSRFFADFPRFSKPTFPKFGFPELPSCFRYVFQEPQEEEGAAPVQEAVLSAVHYKADTKYIIKGATDTPEATSQDQEQEKQMREAFRKVAGEDLEIDAYELRDILNAAYMREFKFDGFSDDTCRGLVAMMDVDRSGKLGFDEFQKLWNDLRLWKTAFKEHDADNSGNFNSYELRRALNAIGFKVSNCTFNALVMRYAHKDGKIFFDDYIHCVARMKTMFDIYKDQSKGRSSASFEMDEFIQTTMYS